MHRILLAANSVLVVVCKVVFNHSGSAPEPIINKTIYEMNEFSDVFGGTMLIVKVYTAKIVHV